MHNDPEIMPEGCSLIDFPSVHDERGSLTFAEAMRAIPFAVQRVFWIYDVPTEARRGGHAHWTCSEVVIPVNGGLTMTVDDGRRRGSVRLQRADQGLLVPAGIWCELSDFEPGTVLVVMASHDYDTRGYVHDYETYKCLKTEKR